MPSRLRIPWRRVGIGAASLAALVVGVVVVRAATVVAPATGEWREPPSLPSVNVDTVAEHLAGAVRIPTISHEDPAEDDPAAFDALHAYLRAAYPRVAAELEWEVLGEHSLLLTWEGTESTLAPLVLMAHMDVVPVEPDTESDWSHPPFAGAIAEGYVWGRGTMDDKLGVVGQLEAVESLLGEGFTPQRRIYLAFGHDEEVGGEQGARIIAEALAARGVEPAMVLDEGGVVVEGALPGLSRPAALIGISEKGFVTLELTAKGQGGHSSMPPAQTSIGVRAAAIERLEADPFPARVTPPTRAMFEWLAPDLGFGVRLVAANLWLLEGPLRAVLAGQAATAGVVRTTTAVTVIDGGTKANVLPGRARALVNHRTIPGDDVEAVRARVESVIDDPRVEVRVLDGRNATSISPAQGPAFASLVRAIRWTYPEAAVAPYLVVAATDARHWDGRAEAVYRFLPVYLGPRDRPRLHGTDERVRLEDLGRAVEFYAALIVDFAAPPGP